MARKKQQGMTFVCLLIAAFFLYLIMGSSLSSTREGKRGQSCAACRAARGRSRAVWKNVSKALRRHRRVRRRNRNLRRKNKRIWRKWVKNQCKCKGVVKKKKKLDFSSARALKKYMDAAAAKAAAAKAVAQS
jgi:hypothetical protein